MSPMRGRGKPEGSWQTEGRAFTRLNRRYPVFVSYQLDSAVYGAEAYMTPIRYLRPGLRMNPRTGTFSPDPTL